MVKLTQDREVFGAWYHGQVKFENHDVMTCLVQFNQTKTKANVLIFAQWMTQEYIDALADSGHDVDGMAYIHILMDDTSAIESTFRRATVRQYLNDRETHEIIEVDGALMWAQEVH